MSSDIPDRVISGLCAFNSPVIYDRNVQMYSQRPDLTSISKPDLPGNSKTWLAP